MMQSTASTRQAVSSPSMAMLTHPHRATLILPSDGDMETEEEVTSASSSSSSSAPERNVPQVKTVMPLSDVNIRCGLSTYHPRVK